MTHLIEAWGVLAVFLLSVAQSLGVPTSSELTFGLVGLLWGLGRMNPVEGIAAGVAGETLGAVAAWWLAEVAVGTRWWERFERHPVVHAFRGVLTVLLGRRLGVLISRLIPLERNVAAWAAGLAEVPFVTLVTQSALGTSLFATAFVVAGYSARSAVIAIAHRAGQVGEVLAVLIALGVVLAVRHLVHRQVARRATPQPAAGAEVQLLPDPIESGDFSSAAYLDALSRIHRNDDARTNGGLQPERG